MVLLLKVYSFRIVPGIVKILSRHTVLLGDVVILPFRPDDLGHFSSLSLARTKIKPLRAITFILR